jgi:hypothetical protein
MAVGPPYLRIIRRPLHNRRGSRFVVRIKARDATGDRTRRPSEKRHETAQQTGTGSLSWH